MMPPEARITAFFREWKQMLERCRVTEEEYTRNVLPHIPETRLFDLEAISLRLIRYINDRHSAGR